MSAGRERQQQIEAAVRLAGEIKASWQQDGDPYYTGPWEHLGDAERDVRTLVSGLDALAARLSGLQDTLAEIRRVALDGDDGRICDALARCDAIDEIAALALNTDGPDGGAS